MKYDETKNYINPDGSTGGLVTNCIIEGNVYIAKTATVEDSTLIGDITISANSEIKVCELHDKVTVDAFTYLYQVNATNTLIGFQTTIKNSELQDTSVARQNHITDSSLVDVIMGNHNEVNSCTLTDNCIGSFNTIIKVMMNNGVNVDNYSSLSLVYDGKRRKKLHIKPFVKLESYTYIELDDTVLKYNNGLRHTETVDIEPIGFFSKLFKK